MGDQRPAPRLPIGDGRPTPRPPMDDNGRRSRRLPFTQLGQADRDFALAEALQEQERAFMMLTSMDREGGDDNIGDSETDDSDDDLDDSSSDEDFLVYHDEMEGEPQHWQLEDLGEEDSEYQDNGEDSSDQEELSYEELLALEEVIGSESRGMPTDVIASLPYSTYKLQPKSNDTLTQCVICQSDYEEGEKLMLLPCDHSYHWECINTWLQMSKVCPICGKEVASSTPV